MSFTPAARLRLSLIAFLAAAAFAAAGARAGGMPPEEEIDANGAPIDAAPAPMNTADTARATTMPVGLAVAPAADPSAELSPAALASPSLPSPDLAVFRDHR